MKKLHIRIMLPFIGLFLVVTLISLLLDRHYIGKMMDKRISRETDRVISLLSNSPFVFNPLYLNKLRDVLEGDIIIFDRKNIIVSTFSKNDIPDLQRLIKPEQLVNILSKRKTTGVQNSLIINGQDYMLTSRLINSPLKDQNKMLLCIIFPMSDLLNTKSKITGWIFLTGFCGLLLVILLGYLISLSVTRPIKEIVAVTGRIANGDFAEKATIPRVKELEMLSVSINTMSDKLKDYEQKIAKASHMAATGKVTAAMAHEIRNPLSSIKMMAQLLNDRLKKEQNNSNVIISMIEEINRLERIVRDLTDLMKPSELSLSLYDINELIKEIFSVIKPKAKHLNIDLFVDFEQSLPKVRIDNDKIKQVIWNLLLNGLESMPRGGVLKIITRLNQPAGNIEVIIEDEGCGVNEEIIEEIFTCFYTTKQEGLGLGLATSREIMEKHKGSLIITNLKEKGARAVATFSDICHK